MTVTSTAFASPPTPIECVVTTDPERREPWCRICPSESVRVQVKSI